MTRTIRTEVLFTAPSCFGGGGLHVSAIPRTLSQSSRGPLDQGLVNASLSPRREGSEACSQGRARDRRWAGCPAQRSSGHALGCSFGRRTGAGRSATVADPAVLDGLGDKSDHLVEAGGFVPAHTHTISGFLVRHARRSLRRAHVTLRQPQCGSASACHQRRRQRLRAGYGTQESRVEPQAEASGTTRAS